MRKTSEIESAARSDSTCRLKLKIFCAAAVSHGCSRFEQPFAPVAPVAARGTSPTTTFYLPPMTNSESPGSDVPEGDVVKRVVSAS
jgi:hypothetical protein